MKTILEQLGKIKEPTTILIHGKPGTGKTMFALALASELSSKKRMTVYQSGTDEEGSLYRKAFLMGQKYSKNLIQISPMNGINIKQIDESLLIARRNVILDDVTEKDMEDVLGFVCRNLEVLIVTTQTPKSGKIQANELRHLSKIEIQMIHKNGKITPKVLKNRFGPIGEIDWSIND